MTRLLAPLLLLALLAPPVRATDEGPGGFYLVRGSAQPGGAYYGAARVARTAKGLELVLRREALGLRGELARQGDEWVCETRPAPGLAAKLPFVAAGEGELRCVTRYRALGRILVGRWTLFRGTERVASGREELRPPRRARGAVRLAISVDWEGNDLRDENLAAIEAFRRDFPEVRLNHFLNAAYYTKVGLDEPGRARVSAAIRRALRDGDELGVHLHGWRSLFEAAGVSFRRAPSFWGPDRPLVPLGGDEGHEVEIAAYTGEELRRVLTFSRETLTKAGFRLGGSFRAGGWVAPQSVLEAVRAAGFQVDASAVPPGWHDELAGLALRERLRRLWSTVEETTQPYAVKTPLGPLVEMPDTGALADYVTADEMRAHVRAALARWRRRTRDDLYVHLGFHQETAARYLPRLRQALEALRADADPGLVHETLAEGAARVRVRLEEAARLAAARQLEAGLPPPFPPEEREEEDE
ncbi:MAG: hypothetical protein AB7N76_28105 [Planctomycetota bacterium]